MKKVYLHISVCCCLLMITGVALAQDYDQMREEIVQKQENTRAEIQQLSNQINTYEKRLKLADQKYEALYNKYKDLKHLIALQDEKLSKLQTEQSQIEQEIEVTTQSLEQKREELEQLIENYKKTLGYLYKHGRTSQLAMIFSSSSINQMLVRAFYLEEFNKYRDEQAQKIRDTEKELKQTKKQLVEAQSRNKDVLAEIREEKSELAEKKKQQEKNVALLRENREEIQNKLKEVQQQKEQLNSTLTNLIREEEKIREAQEARIARLERERKQKLAAAKKIEDDAERASEVAKYSEPVETGNFMSSEELEKVEERFAQKKGKLSWPVESRTISEHFGRRRHPVYGTFTSSLGIAIVTESRASVQVVHDGYVFAVRPIPGFGDVVFVKHGRFYTAYGNLSEIMVRKNQILDQGDVVGLAGDENSVKGESLFFLIRENTQSLDPEKWLQTETVTGTR